MRVREREKYEVVARDGLFLVVDTAGTTVGGPYAERWHANQKKRHLVEHTKPASEVTLRDCITCQSPFDSEGIHNRMCAGCRSKSQPVAI